jgi:hypothetical protein
VTPASAVSALKRIGRGAGSFWADSPGKSATLDLGSANGERRAEPPRREGRRLPPLSELDDLQRREFPEALLDAGTFEDLPGKWRAAILEAEQNRPKLRVVRSD